MKRMLFLAAVSANAFAGFAATPDLSTCDSWQPATSCNFQVSNRPASAAISYVIIHKVQGSAAGAASWFQNCAAGVSAHYAFNNSTGYCYQSVREKDIAWHCINRNTNGIGIEHGGYVTSNDTATVCYDESALETKSCIVYYGVQYNRSRIQGHSEVPGNSHTDPGAYWNWTYYMSKCNPGTPLPPPPLVLNSAPDVVSWGQGRMDVVVRGSNNNVYHRTYVNGAWQGWADLGAQCNGSPSICSMWPGRLDVFMRGFDNNLWHNAGNGAGTWYGWENLGDTLTASPDCVSRGDGKIDVVFRGSNDDIWHRWMSGWAWVGYNNQGLDANGDPTICAMPDGRLDIFTRGYDNNLWHNAGPGNNTWWGWENLGDFLSSNPDAVSRGLGKTDVVFRGSSDDVWHRWMSGYAWAGYNNQGLDAASDPTICAMPDGRLDMYATGYDGCLWHNAGPGNNTWWGWENLGKP